MTSSRKTAGRTPAEDTMFPAPASPTGRLLAYLVGQEVPGTGIETNRAALARGSRQDADDVATALRRLEQDGFILLEGTGDTVTVTVLLAPPLEEYGITPRWGGPAAPAPPSSTPAAPPPPAASTNTAAPPPAGTAPRPAAAASPARKTAVKAPAQAAQTTAGQAPRAQPPAQPAEPPAQPAPEAASKTGQSAAGKTARTARKTAAPAVDETAVLRGFVERFEALLAELDEAKRRAQAAEDRAATVEKLLRDAERRAQAAEQRLAAVEERAQSWSDLTRRMQELARKADGSRGSRPRASKQ